MKRVPITIVIVLFFIAAIPVLAAPTAQIYRTLLPENTDTYDLGSSQLEWNNAYIKSLNVTGTCTGCSGSSGSGTATTSFAATYPITLSISSSKITYGFAGISTSTTPSLNQVAYWTSNSTFAGNAAFTFNGSLVTATNASTTNFWSGGNTWLAANGGKVGVGTTTPLTDLVVSDSGGNFGNGPQIAVDNGSLTGTIEAMGPSGSAMSNGHIIMSSFGYTNTVNAVSSKGGVTAAISTNANAEFRVDSTSNGSAYNQLFKVTSGGNAGVGSTTPGTLLSIGGNGTGVNFIDNGTTTFSGKGINLIGGGCFAVNGTCITGGGGSGTIGGSISANQVAYGSGSNAIQGNANLTFDGSLLTDTGNATTTGNASFGSSGAQRLEIRSNNSSLSTTYPYIRFDSSGDLVLEPGSSGTLYLNFDHGATNDVNIGGNRLIVNGSTGRIGIGSTTPAFDVSLGNKTLYLGASSAGGSETSANLFIHNLATAAGSFVAVDPKGQIIATTTPSSGGTTVTNYTSDKQSSYAIVAVPVVSGDVVKFWMLGWSSSASGCSGAAPRIDVTIKLSTWLSSTTDPIGGGHYGNYNNGESDSCSAPGNFMITASSTGTLYVDVKPNNMSFGQVMAEKDH